ncbi:hypothetical protein Ahy_B04g071095 [Arachis hypogaea]|uniref:Uncharacterized protein n=1 Tax=Arachis hypogaea TaxID=3818 RepID=A0A444ZK07_ARAHY|nr:hypothetical protein Ahy_B04g071095 [Arachis hypogaea]
MPRSSFQKSRTPLSHDRTPPNIIELLVVPHLRPTTASCCRHRYRARSLPLHCTGAIATFLPFHRAATVGTSKPPLRNTNQKIFHKKMPPELEACAHPFFDELREPNAHLLNGRPFPPLFNFKEELTLSTAPLELDNKLILGHMKQQLGLQLSHSAGT